MKSVPSLPGCSRTTHGNPIPVDDQHVDSGYGPDPLRRVYRADAC